MRAVLLFLGVIGKTIKMFEISCPKTIEKTIGKTIGKTINMDPGRPQNNQKTIKIDPKQSKASGSGGGRGWAGPGIPLRGRILIVLGRF